MTILEAIVGADSRRHNTYSQGEKIRWLGALDGKIALFQGQHEGEHPAFSGYGDATPTSTTLLVGPPFDEIYLYWLEAQICYADGEIADYNAAIAQYNRLYGAFANAYKRSHTPKGAGRFRF